MDQSNSVPDEASSTIHVYGKIIHEENLKENQVHQYTRDNPPRWETDERIGGMLQPNIHQDYQSPTKDSNQPHRTVINNSEQKKIINICALKVWQKQYTGTPDEGHDG